MVQNNGDNGSSKHNGFSGKGEEDGEDEVVDNGSREENHRSDGTFKPGHKASRGGGGGHTRALAKQVRKLRRVAVTSVDEEDIREIFQKMTEMAVSRGSVHAARFVMEYTVGKPIEADMIDRVERMEDVLATQMSISALQRQGVQAAADDDEDEDEET